uniref:Structural maintenance of chromosomes protein 4 n=1 Tax=Ditylum brightwellii TaxID=49249 RepID=A0A7S4QBT5_9STRA
MAGGGKSVRKGGMRLSNGNKNVPTASVSVSDTSEEDCRKIQAQAKEALEELQKCRSTRRALSDEIRSLEKRIKTLSVKIPKLAMEIAGCDTTRSELTERIPELREQSTLSEEDAQKVKDLKEKVEKCKSDMASCAKLASELETEVAKLQKSILDAGGSKLKKQQSSCQKALENLNNANKTLNSAKVTIQSATKASSKAKKAKEQSEKDMEKCNSVLEKKTAKFENLTEEAKEVMEAYENVKKVELEKRTELEAISKECEDLKKSQSKVKCVEVELVGQIENFDKQLHDCEKRAKHWESEIAKLHKAEDQDDEFDFSDDESEDEVEEDNVENMPTDDDEMVSKDDDVDMPEADGISDGGEVKDKKKEKKNQIDKSSLPTLPHTALEQFSREEVKRDIALLEKERDTLAKNANMGAIAEYRKKEADYLSRIGELDEVTEERNKARRVHEELRRQRLEKFMNGFGHITVKLKEMYQMITLGGDAELELVDSLDPFSEGIVFSVRPPKKSWKNIANLSGGEKTLSSLALVFALHHYKPTPLYVMDEIDAALDFKNVSIVANYIKDRTKNAQFIIISLRNNMFELADRLVGIYKTNNCTKSMTINPRAFGKSGQQNGASYRRVSAPLGDRTNMNQTSTSTEKRRQSAHQSVPGVLESA